MNMNSYGWIALIVVLVVVVAWVGGQAGFTTESVPKYSSGEIGYQEVVQPVSNNPLSFIGNLAIGNVEGMPDIFTWFLDAVPFLIGWIIYRQIRGQD